MLYGVVQWINGNPVLNGMKYFINKGQCFNYINMQPHVDFAEVEYTIIELEKGY